MTHVYRWTEVWDEHGEVRFAMVPTDASRSSAERAYKPGETYRLTLDDKPSDAARGRYFATLKELWDNLPEEAAQLKLPTGDIINRFPTPDHLRKHCLIQLGHYDEAIHVCQSTKAAQDLVRFMSRTWAIGKRGEDYRIISNAENVVVVRTAKSQATMGRKAFNKAADDVLALIQAVIDRERDI